LINEAINFRENCLWKGELLNPSTLAKMFFTNCKFPKDQLFGIFGLPYYSHKGKSLDVADVEGSYYKVLEFLGLPAFIGPRIEGDGTGMDGYITPYVWRVNAWPGSSEYKIPQHNKVRQAEQVMSIPLDSIPKRSLFGHTDWKISYTSLDIWAFKDNSKFDWLAFGYPKDQNKRVGKVLFCVRLNLDGLFSHSILLAHLGSLIDRFTEGKTKGQFDSFEMANLWKECKDKWAFRVDFDKFFEEITINENLRDRFDGTHEFWSIS